MPKPTSQERRKQLLKQRQAEFQVEVNREEAEFLCARAFDAHHAGDAPAADRMLKKALALHPDHVDALRLLAEIHEIAGHHANALGHLRRLRKLTDEPAVLYNIGTVYRQPGSTGESRRDDAGVSGRNPKIARTEMATTAGISQSFLRF